MVSQSGLSVTTSPARIHASANRESEAVKKNGPLTRTDDSQTTADSRTELLTLTESELPELWQRLIVLLGEKWPILANHLKMAIYPAIPGPNSLVIRFPSSYNYLREACATEVSLQRIQEALRQLTGQSLMVTVEIVYDPQVEAAVSQPAATQRPGDQRKYLLSLPLFKKAAESLGAQLWHVDDEFHPVATRRHSPNPGSESETDES
jgi:DNA polymerase-3 subunit gamma/tau